MTVLLYQTNSYLKAFEAKVARVTEMGVVLNQTAFYPGGGGQPADWGILTGEDDRSYRVTGAKRIEGDPVFLLEGKSRPEPGTIVKGTVDWDRRYALMRTHTALHMLSGLVWRDYRSKVTGGNMEPYKGRLDFELPEGSQDLAREIEEKMAREVTAARPVSIRILPRDQAFEIPDLIRTKINLLPAGIHEVRVVNIEGLDMQADGGTHVANTREVGALRVTRYRSKGKGNKRLYIELDEYAG